MSIANLLGSFIATALQQAAMSRADMAEHRRRDFWLYVDEFQNFATESFATILSVGAQVSAWLDAGKQTGANQYLAQIDEAMSDALHASESPLSVIDPATNRVYILVDHDTHQQAMAALHRQRSVASIQAGIDDMEAGRMQPAKEAHRQGREELLSRFQQ